ncbi:hypothetical protein ACGF3G_00145 [Streptomyces sp. NPDC048179]|uniref:hypothetical protein n=1 Tax=Streptomyces sp. NPDC048179 TaxID=3365506 RepID=UPI003716DFB4
MPYPFLPMGRAVKPFEAATQRSILRAFALTAEQIGIPKAPVATLTPKETPMSARYTGRLVLIERINPTKEHDASGDGQYLVYAETGSQLFAHRMSGGYNSGGLSVYGLGGGFRGDGVPLAGEAAYRVVSVDDPEEWMLDALDHVDEQIRKVRAGEVERQWVGHVYDYAEQRSRLFRQLLTKRLAEVQADAEPPEDDADGEAADVVCESVDGPPTITVTVPRGHRLVVSYA